MMIIIKQQQQHTNNNNTRTYVSIIGNFHPPPPSGLSLHSSHSGQTHPNPLILTNHANQSKKKASQTKHYGYNHPFWVNSLSPNTKLHINPFSRHPTPHKCSQWLSTWPPSGNHSWPSGRTAAASGWGPPIAAAAARWRRFARRPAEIGNGMNIQWEEWSYAFFHRPHCSQPLAGLEDANHPPGNRIASMIFFGQMGSHATTCDFGVQKCA